MLKAKLGTFKKPPNFSDDLTAAAHRFAKSPIVIYLTSIMTGKTRPALLALAIIAGIFAMTAGPAAPAPRPGKGNGKPPVATASDMDSAPVAVFARQVDAAETQLDAISLHARAGNLSDTDLRSRLAAIPPIQVRLAGALDDLEPRLKSADARLAQLGPVPGPGQPPEDPETAQSRQEILHYRQSVDVEVKQARLLTTEADQLTTYLNDRRRRLFSQRLWIKAPSALDPQLWIGFVQSLPSDLGKLDAIADQEVGLATARAGSAIAALLWALAVLLAALLTVPVWLFLDRWGTGWLAKRSAVGHGAGVLVAVWWVVVAGLVPLAMGAAILAALTAVDALTPLFAQILSLLWKSAVYGALLYGVGRALLAPSRSAAPLAADRLAPYPVLIAATATIGSFVAGLNGLAGISAATNDASGYLTLLLQLAVIISGLSQIGRARIAHANNAPAADRPRSAWIIAAIVAWLTVACAGAAILAGYLALATFLVREMVWAAGIIAAIFLLMRGVDAAIAGLLSPARPLGRAIRVSIGLSEMGLAQVVELVSGLMRLSLVLAAWWAILAPLGADAQDVFGRITSTDLVLRLGQIIISPGTVIGALLVLGAGLAATQTLRSWLEFRYLPKTHMDMGLRTSLASGVTYVGIFIAFLLTCADLGLSLDRIALFASALTVGIGFGLQAIIGNFVSGLILLAERPIRVGDWIAIGDLEGDVRRINVRATEIEMGDRSRLIVPNSELVSKMVRNVTHGAALGQVKIVLSLAAGIDPLAVRALLLEHLRAHPGALTDPAPSVYLSDIKNGAMEFTAFAYLPSPRAAYQAKSDLLFKIVPALKAQGMTLASSAPVVHVAMAQPPAASAAQVPVR